MRSHVNSSLVLYGVLCSVSASHITRELMDFSVCPTHLLSSLWHTSGCKWGWNQLIVITFVCVIMDTAIWLGHSLTSHVWPMVGWNWILFWLVIFLMFCCSSHQPPLIRCQVLIQSHLCLGIVFWNSCEKILWLYCLQQSSRVWEQRGETGTTWESLK
jgi:hypothetical protein